MKNIFIDFKKNIDYFLLDNKNILDENIRLKKEIQNYKIKNIFSNYYYNRTKELENILRFSENNSPRHIFNVFSNNDMPLQSKFILKNNSYFKDGIGDTVYVFDNFAIGRIDYFDNVLIKVKRFFDYNVKENYILMSDGEVVFKGEGVGQSSGLIKLELPRDLKISEDSIILLEDGISIVGVFLKDNFKSQNTERDVYFRSTLNPESIFQVEI